MLDVDSRSEILNPSSPEYGYTEITRDFFESLGEAPGHDELISFRAEIRDAVIADIACITMSRLAGAIRPQGERTARDKRIVPLYYGLDGNPRSGNEVGRIINLNPGYIWRLKWKHVITYGTAILRKEVLASRERP